MRSIHRYLQNDERRVRNEDFRDAQRNDGRKDAQKNDGRKDAQKKDGHEDAQRNDSRKDAQKNDSHKAAQSNEERRDTSRSDTNEVDPINAVLDSYVIDAHKFGHRLQESALALRETEYQIKRARLEFEEAMNITDPFRIPKRQLADEAIEILTKALRVYIMVDVRTSFREFEQNSISNPSP